MMKKKYLIPEASICMLSEYNMLMASPNLQIFNADGDDEVITEQVLSRQSDYEWD